VCFAKSDDECVAIANKHEKTVGWEQFLHASLFTLRFFFVTLRAVKNKR
jgi:hypothetical protein